MKWLMHAPRWRRALAGGRRELPLLLVVLWAGLCGVRTAGAPAVEGGADPTITNPDVIWQMTNEERRRAYPLRLEGRVNYYDAPWGGLWFESDGQGRYIRLTGNPPVLRNGQRVRIEGSFVPAQGLAADRVRVTVLADYEPVTPVPTAGRINEVRTFDRKIVVTEGYVDEQQLIDSLHLRLMLLVEDRRVIVWVPPEAGRPLPDLAGRRISLTAVYSGRLDPTGTEATVELWAGRLADITVLGTREGDPLFAAPRAEIARLNEQPVGTLVRVQGQMRRRDLGTSFVLRDDTGEVLVHSLQRERVPAGAEVEVVGRLAITGSRWHLESALFRPTVAPGPSPAAGTAVLERVDRIRQLSAAEVAAGRAVDIRGVVTWSLPEVDFFFLQDLGGGTRVRVPAGAPPPPMQQYVRIEGTTSATPTGPVVDLRAQYVLGAMAHPYPKRITYRQAITGSEDAQWVEMRGFLRRADSEGDWHSLYLTTPEGEFVAHLQSPVALAATPGSLLRVRGVCEATTDDKGRISGARLRVPFLHDILIEEDAPAELYDLPLRAVGDLRQLFTMEEMVRARISAQVIQHVPGEYLVVQDEGHGLTVFARDTGQQLVPGDWVEVVGIVGQDGARMVLREAVFRRTRAAAAPEPLALGEVPVEDFSRDLRLVRVRGTLLDSARYADHTHLTLQNAGTIFDAVLQQPPGLTPLPRLRPGMGLELTGVYRIVFDDFDRAQGFQVQLRSAADLTVFRAAQFWTVRRALSVAAIVGGGMLVVFVWVAALRHRVRRQTEQIRQQLEKQSNLEAELERAQRFRSLGLLAGGLAHDFNNLLTGILGNVTLAMLDARVMAAAGESLRDIEASAKRARDLTQQLVTFAKGGDPLRASVAVAELLQNAATFALSGGKARAQFQLPPDLWAVHADRAQLGRALQNLLVHARAATGEGGAVRIEAANETIDSATGALAAGDYVRVSITDQGPGVPAERLPGFFDPYSATKFGDDRFSLAIAFSIVRRHGGNLEVESTLGVGTVFRLWIPAVPESATAPVPAAPEPTELPTNIAGTRVLLMDDEETIRRLGERILQRLECECRTVPDGGACLAAYREALAGGTPFQVVILDLTVAGGMGGAECMAELLKLDPEVRAIVSSGYSNDPVMANHRQHGFRAVVPKPYTAAVLADAIGRVLGASR